MADHNEQGYHPDTIAIRGVVNGIREDERWISSLLPVGDGLLVAVRR